MPTLQNKTLSGLFWSFLENFAKQGVNFIIGIVLARLLLPEQFGLIGMIMVFIAISYSFTDSGFTQALIRKQNCTNVDYATVFFFNLLVGFAFAILLILSAPLIASFFNEPKLTNIVRVISSVLIIDSFTIVQRARLTKRIDFKLQTKVSLAADVIGGITAIILAYMGYGVWSLVTRLILSKAINSTLLWIYNQWKPIFTFSKDSFKEMFSFGSKLMVSGLLNTLYKNIYTLVIGKYFSASELGYYTRADQFKNLPSQNLTGVIQRVTYPVLAELQGDKEILKRAYRKIIVNTMFITSMSMLCLGGVAKPLILALLGEKWASSIPFLQLLVFVGFFYPLHSINLNLLNVLGRSDLFMKLSFVKKGIESIVVLLGIYYGIEIMIVGMIIYNIIAFFLNSYFSGRYIQYTAFDQIKDILPSFIVALVIGGILFIGANYLRLSNIYVLLLSALTAFLLIIAFGEIFRLKGYLSIKNILLKKNK